VSPKFPLKAGALQACGSFTEGCLNLFNLYNYQGHVIILANAPGVFSQGFEDCIKDILGAKPVVAPYEILKTLLPEHGLAAVPSFPDAVRADRDHLARA